MSILEAILLGLIQGLTEFIPVSSSGHLLLAQEALGNGNNLLFDVMLHVGTLAAIIVYFRADLLRLALNISKKNSDGRLARLLLLATLPAVVAGLLAGDFIDSTLRSPYVVVVTLLVVGIVMLLVDRKATEKRTELSRKDGVLVGFAQALALIPGVSRSGITMTTAIALGISREQAARFSFLLAVPIIAGSALGMLLDRQGESLSLVPLGAGLVTAFLSGLAAIAFLLAVIRRVGLKPFAYYRIALAIIVFIVIV